MASELKSTSLNQKAWRRLKRNKSAMFGLAVILLCVLLSVLAYIISPDNSPSANEQILQLETHPPGFKISILKIQKQGFEKSNFIDGAINGFAKDYTPVPILSYQVENDSLKYEEYRGRTFKPELKKISLAELGIENTNDKNSASVESIIGKRKFWLGTDKFGRDILSRLLIGVRVSLSVGLISVFISLFIGIILGAVAGYFYAHPPKIKLLNLLSLLFYIPFGILLPVAILVLILKPESSFPFVFFFAGLKGFIPALALNVIAKYWIKFKVKFPVDGIIMWVINVFWSIPTLLLAMGLYISAGSLIENKLVMIFIAVGLTMWVETARIVRGQFLSVREMEFVDAAKSLGFSDLRIIFKHILPNIMGPIIVVACANFASSILVESGLSYIGLGIQPPAPSWGSMLNEYKDFMDTDKAYLALYPGLSIMLLVLAFNLVGNGLRDALDVRGQLE